MKTNAFLIFIFLGITKCFSQVEIEKFLNELDKKINQKQLLAIKNRNDSINASRLGKLSEYKPTICRYNFSLDTVTILNPVFINSKPIGTLVIQSNYDKACSIKYLILRDIDTSNIEMIKMNYYQRFSMPITKTSGPFCTHFFFKKYFFLMMWGTNNYDDACKYITMHIESIAKELSLY